MNVTITPGLLRGSVAAIPSKSHAHRALICAAFAEGETKLVLDAVNGDIQATADCLMALGADIHRESWGYRISPVQAVPEKAVLNCRESGSTLRFLLPVVGALGAQATFQLAGRLPNRPLSPLWEEMERMGCKLQRKDSTILCSGQLKSGIYRIPGNVSSQFISGLLFAGAVKSEIEVHVLGNLESKPYVDMTREVLEQFGVKTLNLSPVGSLRSPGEVRVEGDWSNAAFFLTAAALGSDVTVTGLNGKSSQGDREIVEILKKMSQHCVISASDIPDLIPILSVAAACNRGAVFTDIRRLRLKESDRVQSILDMITALGGSAEADENTLTIHGTGLLGGTVDSRNDHRIAMAAAIAATVCKNTVTILDAGAVDKSYPRFWEDYRHLGGNYEQYLR